MIPGLDMNTKLTFFYLSSIPSGIEYEYQTDVLLFIVNPVRDWIWVAKSCTVEYFVPYGTK
ncbi:MAG: hypothetical protein Q8M08_12895 [Bacteroidales bacterium]|nr:hypothetical protein [Bacteroidales bacterium]